MNKPEVIVRDLMQSFLLPDVQRRKLQRQGNEGLRVSLVRGEAIPRSSTSFYSDSHGNYRCRST